MPSANIINQLLQIRASFGIKEGKRKLKCLKLAANEPLDDPRTLCLYHELLLFIAAYPNDSPTRRLAEAQLKRVGKAALLIHRNGTAKAIRALRNTGIAGTETDYSFTFDTTKWLSQRFGNNVELVWEDGSAGEALDDFLPALLPSVEQDGLLSSKFTTQDWIQLAKGDSYKTNLSWLLQQMMNVDCSDLVFDLVYDSLDLCIRWKLTDQITSRTHIRFPVRSYYYHSSDLLRTVEIHKIVRKPIQTVRRLPQREATTLIDIARASMCVRQRETDPLTYANPKEVTMFSLDRGIDIAIYGMQPQRRLPIESFFGYVVAKNRIPVAYGGGWVFQKTSEIGINIFDTFRGGESAYIFGQILRVYHQHFGVNVFEVPPFQIGQDNPDGITSGAFWFYYRLGFRPSDSKLSDLATRYWQRIQQEKKYRTPKSILRRLAEAKLRLVVQSQESLDMRLPQLSSIGIAVTHWIGRKFAGDRQKAQKYCVKKIEATLRSRTVPANCGKMERNAFEQLCVLVAMIPTIDQWPTKDKNTLAQLMYAKGGTRERDYVRKMQQHDRLKVALEKIAEIGQDNLK